jgi:tRNA uridine 5-carbamoylmethylation protein Kti12
MIEITISGPQKSGRSRLARFLKSKLEEALGRWVDVVDDGSSGVVSDDISVIRDTVCIQVLRSTTRRRATAHE